MAIRRRTPRRHVSDHEPASRIAVQRQTGKPRRFALSKIEERIRSFGRKPDGVRIAARLGHDFEQTANVVCGDEPCEPCDIGRSIGPEIVRDSIDCGSAGERAQCRTGNRARRHGSQTLVDECLVNVANQSFDAHLAFSWRWFGAGAPSFAVALPIGSAGAPATFTLTIATPAGSSTK
jgi:hypothetical protein